MLDWLVAGGPPENASTRGFFSVDEGAKADAGMMALATLEPFCQRTLIPTPPSPWLSSMDIAYQLDVPILNVPDLSVIPCTKLLSTTHVVPIHNLEPSSLSVKNVQTPVDGMLMKPAIRSTNLDVDGQFEKNVLGSLPIEGCGRWVHALGIRIPPVSPEVT